MIETLYQTDQPVKGKSECYVLVLTARPSTRRKVYTFMREHGKWNDEFGRFLYEVDSIGASENLTHEEASALYDTARHELTSRGFVHSFRPDFQRKTPHTEHKHAALEAVTA
jgi:hypothetical protein